jgi:hypothetical protein
MTTPGVARSGHAMPESRDPEILRAARAMINYHGRRDALAFTLRALANVQHLNLPAVMVEHWEQVSAAIREITADHQASDDGTR